MVNETNESQQFRHIVRITILNIAENLQIKSLTEENLAKDYNNYSEGENIFTETTDYQMFGNFLVWTLAEFIAFEVLD